MVQNIENELIKKGRDIKFAKLKLSKNPELSEIKTISDNISGEISNDNKPYRCVTWRYFLFQIIVQYTLYTHCVTNMERNFQSTRWCHMTIVVVFSLII